MPHTSRNHLPENVKNVLPPHAQEIYQKAFNNAWEEYQNPEKRRGSESREDVSHKVAWAAVKAKFQKKGDTWIAKEE